MNTSSVLDLHTIKNLAAMIAASAYHIAVAEQHEGRDGELWLDHYGRAHRIRFGLDNRSKAYTAHLHNALRMTLRPVKAWANLTDEEKDATAAEAARQIETLRAAWPRTALAITELQEAAA